MFDPVNIQKLIGFLALLNTSQPLSADTAFSRSSSEYTQTSSLLRALAKALWTCPEKKYSWSVKTLKPLPLGGSRKISFFKWLPYHLFILYMLYNNNVFPRVNISLSPRILSEALANFNQIWQMRQCRKFMEVSVKLEKLFSQVKERNCARISLLKPKKLVSQVKERNFTRTPLLKPFHFRKSFNINLPLTAQGISKRGEQHVYMLETRFIAPHILKHLTWWVGSVISNKMCILTESWHIHNLLAWRNTIIIVQLKFHLV